MNADKIPETMYAVVPTSHDGFDKPECKPVAVAKPTADQVHLARLTLTCLQPTH